MADQSGWNPAPGQPNQPGYGQQQPSPGAQPGYGQQPYPGAQPGYGQQPYAVAPPRKRRKWPWILGGFFLLLVIGVGSCTFFVVNLVSGPLDGANEWMALVDDGRYGEAYDSMCDSTRASADAATFELLLESEFGAGIDGYQLSSVQSTNGNTSVDGTVEVAGEIRSIAFFMNNEGDTWRVCSFRTL